MEQKAKSLSPDIVENNASGNFLKNAFYLIDEAKKDLQGNPDLALKKIKVIKKCFNIYVNIIKYK